MTQENIVYLILSITFIYILYSIISGLRTKKDNPCADCPACSDIEEQMDNKVCKKN